MLLYKGYFCYCIKRFCYVLWNMCKRGVLYRKDWYWLIEDLIKMGRKFLVKVS